jgi:hypothetical protein
VLSVMSVVTGYRRGLRYRASRPSATRGGQIQHGWSRDETLCEIIHKVFRGQPCALFLQGTSTNFRDVIHIFHGKPGVRFGLRSSFPVVASVTRFTRIEQMRLPAPHAEKGPVPLDREGLARAP